MRHGVPKFKVDFSQSHGQTYDKRQDLENIEEATVNNYNDSIDLDAEDKKPKKMVPLKTENTTLFKKS